MLFRQKPKVSYFARDETATSYGMNREELLQHLINTGVLRSPAIIGAFRVVDRMDFVRGDLREVYEDHPLPVGYGQTISQPTTVVFMLELLQARKGDNILDVGSGSGWTTALLAKIVGPSGKVWGLEIVPELIEFGRKNIGKYSFPHAKILQAGEKIGLEEEAPFDKILVSASAEELPEELVAQIKVGGRMVIPIQNSVWKIDKVSEKDTKKEEFPGFVFVPLK